MDRLLPLFRFAEVRAETEKNTESKARRSSQIWPRLLSFNPLSQDCEDEEEEYESEQNPNTCPEAQKEPSCDDSDEEGEEDSGGKVGGAAEGSKPCGGGLGKKLGCMYRGARFGLREGALSGIFFGGAWGMYKYFDAVYMKGEKGGDGGEASDDTESTRNENVIFVTALNGAIAMAVFCTLFCSTKAAIYCS